MAGYITRGQEKSVVLSASQVDTLVNAGSGDAALLYLLLQRLDGPVTPEALAQRLGWSLLRCDAAESALQDMGLLQRPADRRVPEPADERRAYSTEELADLLENDAGFRMLVPQTEEKLGKKLKTADLQILAGLYDDLGLPVDVIYLLVCHCIERAQQRFGPGRRPTLRQIEKEGAYWARLGICDQDSAGRYLSDYARKREKTAAYMQALQLGSRPPVDSEQRYILDWIDMGFTPETVALAYDKTVFYKQGLNWRYLNGILRRWHQQGWHTAEEVAAGERRGPKNGGKPDGGKTDWMDEYL